MFRGVAESIHDRPDSTSLGLKALGGVAIVFGAAEYFLIGSQTTAELIGDSLLEVGGAALIAASYLPGNEH